MLSIITAAALAGCGSDEPSGPSDETRQVAMQDNSFSPTTLTIARGTTVRWTNNGTFQHNSTGPQGAWSSGNLNPGQTFSHEFGTAGTFDYNCTIHQNMSGRIVVQ